MKISYSKLWHLLLDRKIKKKDLEKKAGISHYSMIQMGKGNDISTEILVKICNTLSCGLNDIAEIVSEKD